jgi:hypothetical protein
VLRLPSNNFAFSHNLRKHKLTNFGDLQLIAKGFPS